MSLPFSCVLLIPAAKVEQINAWAESMGYGPDSLSVALINGDGEAWYGCHTWCTQKLLDRLAEADLQADFASALVVSAIDGGDPSSNWAQALSANGLAVVSEDQPT